MGFNETAFIWTGRAAITFTVAAAVAGAAQWWFSQRVSETKDEETRGHLQQTARLQKEVADARTEQSEAETRLNETVIEVDRGRQEIAVANFRAAEANERAAAANSSAAAANERAARTEQANLAMKQELARLEKATADSQRREAEARSELARQVHIVQEQRVNTFPRARFVDALRGKPTATAIVLYQRDNGEAYNLAGAIQQSLVAAGWKTTGLPMPAEPRSPDQPAASAGITITSTRPPAEMRRDTAGAYNALSNAFTGLGWEYGGVGGNWDTTLPIGVFRVIVGSR